MIAKDREINEGSIELKKAPPEFKLTFEGYNGLFTVIYFDHAEVGDHTIRLSKRGGEDTVAEIENNREFDLSSVASALRAIEYNELSAIID